MILNPFVVTFSSWGVSYLVENT